MPSPDTNNLVSALTATLISPERLPKTSLTQIGMMSVTANLCSLSSTLLIWRRWTLTRLFLSILMPYGFFPGTSVVTCLRRAEELPVRKLPQHLPPEVAVRSSISPVCVLILVSIICLYHRLVILILTVCRSRWDHCSCLCRRQGPSPVRIVLSRG